jgi:glycosyltransferase involved in cell wall biosynthesis
MRRNLAVLNRLHPGWDALIAAHRAADPLAPARRRLDEARWRETRHWPRAVLLITHARQGGVLRHVAARCDALRAGGRRPIVLRPIAGGCRVSDGLEEDFPNLRYAIPAELDALDALLRDSGPDHAELHHFLGHRPELAGLPARLGIPCDAVVHDYAWLCPRITLVSPSGGYCGEPPPEVCADCVADAGSRIEEDIAAPVLRARSAAQLGAARRVVVPSQDAAARLRRHFPALRPTVAEWEDERDLPHPGATLPHAGARRVAVVGAIGQEKGYDLLLGCARDAARRALPLRFAIVGHTLDDARLLATEVVTITGPYEAGEAVGLLRAQRADLGFLPSIWPETWSYALTELWQAGLQAAVLDIGAQAERVRRSGRGWTLPLALGPAGLNNALLGAG